jgi:hypothetical protein
MQIFKVTLLCGIQNFKGFLVLSQLQLLFMHFHWSPFLCLKASALLRHILQVEQNAEPAAQAASDQAIRPAGKAVAENAEPVAKQVTDGGLRPAGKAVSENAVPMTQQAMRGQVYSCSP